jgi:hypothetical protein
MLAEVTPLPSPLTTPPVTKIYAVKIYSVQSRRYSRSTNSSTVMPALRINARTVPTDSSLCCGTERLTRNPGLIITTWLPTWPTTSHPALSKTRTACFLEILPSLPMRSHRYQDRIRTRPLGPLSGGLLILRPEPRDDRLSDVRESFGLRLSLRDAAGQGRTFGDDPAVFSLFKNDVKDHFALLSPLASPDRGRQTTETRGPTPPCLWRASKQKRIRCRVFQNHLLQPLDKLMNGSRLHLYDTTAPRKVQRTADHDH